MTAETRWRLRDLRDPRRLRSGWFAVLTRSTDRFMRSPLFLVWMRYSLSAASELQALQADGLSRLLPRWLPRLPRLGAAGERVPPSPHP